MNVFIDLGAYNGDSVEEFRNWRKIAFPDKQDWFIRAFDPNPQFLDKWETIKDASTVFANAAAWTQNGKMQFSIEDSDTPLGSSLMKSKNTYARGKKIEVVTFDFSSYLKSFKNDFMVVKMDIEGAEFPVLDKMIKDGTHTIPDWLLVEFHPNKVAEFTTKDKDDLIKKLKSDGVNILEWH